MSVQQINGAGVANPCTDLVLQDPGKQAEQAANGAPLLEGCPALPNSLHELIVSHLNYSYEHVPLGSEWEFTLFKAEPGEATINTLCKRTGAACITHLDKIATLRHRFNTHLLVAPLADHHSFLGAVNRYFKIGGYRLEPQMALKLCENPCSIHVVNMPYSDEELQEALQSKNAQRIEMDDCNKLRNVCLKLPTVERVVISGTTFQTVDLRNCPQLKYLDCTVEEGVHPVKIDVRGLNCQVEASNIKGVTLHATIRGKEKTVQGSDKPLSKISLPRDEKPESKEGAQA